MAAATAAACGNNYDQLERDRTTIETFLDRHTIETGEYDVIDNVFRYVANVDRPQRDRSPVVARGDEVEFYYEAYAFAATLNMAAGHYNPTLIFATNRPETLDFLCNQQLMGQRAAWNRTIWPEEPVRVRAGDATVVEGVRRGLLGCREGDHVWLFFVSDLGFGEEQHGTVAKNQILAYRIYIENVTKR
ncbi:MAG: hypothetical protein FWE10_04225 [Rikenellaceae bacterium]|nr:hypothetical protein [Rikenellaceae bacterium]MCL2692815.1 hypothetical protein [Rikenellaceae bacterium]